MELTVLPELRDFLPALDAEARQALKDELLRDGGARDKLIIWERDGQRILVDGHNRYELCLELGLPFEVAAREFACLSEAMDWMFRNQKGRRNWTAERERYVRGLLYQQQRRDAEANVAEHTPTAELPDQSSSPKTAKNPTNFPMGQSDPQLSAATGGGEKRTSERIARESGVSEKTVRRDAEYAAALADTPSDVRTAILDKQIRSTKADVLRLARYEHGQQRAILRSITQGEQPNLRQALDAFEAEQEEEPEEEKEVRIEEVVKSDTEAIEKFCRGLTNYFRDNFPDHPWADYHGIRDTAASMVRSACNTLRTMKCEVCPRCKGDGCESCRQHGCVPKMLYDQLV